MEAADGESALQMTQFSDEFQDANFHFQILQLTDQVSLKLVLYTLHSGLGWHLCALL
jgi:hypothetical protein